MTAANPKDLKVGDRVRVTGWNGLVLLLDGEHRGVVQYFNHKGFPVIRLEKPVLGSETDLLTDYYGAAILWPKERDQ